MAVDSAGFSRSIYDCRDRERYFASPARMTDRRERIYVRFEVEDPAGTFTAYECHSDDFGATWSTPA